MVDLSLSSQPRSGMFDKSRMSLSSAGTSRLTREAKDTRSLLSQSLNDVRSQMQGAWTRDDQFLSNRGCGIGGSSSMASARQRLSSSRSSSSLFHGRSLSGFDASRSSGLFQSGGSSRGDPYFLPSVGILGGISQTKATGAFGGSMFGSFSGLSGLHSGFGLQRLMTGSTMFGQSAASGFSGRLYNSASLGNLHHQVQASLNSDVQGTTSASIANTQQVQGCALGSASEQASIDVAGNSDGNVPSLTTSATGSQQAAASEQAEGCEDTDVSDAVGVSEVAQSQSALDTEADLNNPIDDQSDVNAVPQQVEDQAAGDTEVESSSLQGTEVGGHGNYY